MKVLFVDNSLYWGGAEACLNSVMCRLNMYGDCDYKIVFPQPLDHQKQYGLKDDKIYYRAKANEFWMRTGFKTHIRGWGQIETYIYARRLDQILQKYQPNIVHFNLYRRQLIADIKTVRKKAIKIVIHARNQAHEASFSCHALKNADAIIAVSMHIANQIEASCYSLKIDKIYDGVFCHDCNDFSEKTNLSEASKIFRVVAPAVLEPRKGQEEAILALSLIPEQIRKVVLLEILGKENPYYPGYEQHLRNLVADYGLNERVHFLGHIKDMPKAYRNADVVLVLSRQGEAFGMVAAEAAAHGVPVIATNAGALPEIVEHGKTGLLVKPNEPQQVADTLVWMFENRLQCKQISSAAKQRVKEMFDPDRTSFEVYKLYKRLLNEPVTTNS